MNRTTMTMIWALGFIVLAACTKSSGETGQSDTGPGSDESEGGVGVVEAQDAALDAVSRDASIVARDGAQPDTPDASDDTGTADASGTTEYSACGVVRDSYDLIYVYERDTEHGICVTLVLGVWASIDTTSEGFVDNAWVSDDPDECLPPYDQLNGTKVFSSGNTGNVSIVGFLESVDVDVVLVFPEDYPWVPADEALVVSGLDVDCCC
jgi:hypothetical protein